MTEYDKDGEHVQDGEEEETQEPLLGSKPQSATIVAASRGQGPGQTMAARPDRAVDPGTEPGDDVVTSLVGERGWWQTRTTMIIYLTKIPAAWFMACIIFTAPHPWVGEYQCDGFGSANGSQHPVILNPDGSLGLDYCRVFSNATQDSGGKLMSIMGETLMPDRPTEPCGKISYNLDSKTTLITQYDLMCSRSILVAITQSFHLFGVLLGGIIATELMEVFSPKRVMMSGMILQILTGIATGYMPLFWLHVAFRCLAALCCALTFTPGIVIMTDIWGGKYKRIINANFEQFWSIGVILLPAIGYFTNTWAQIYITISLPTVIIMILWWWIPDSPRWHLERSNIKKAQEIIENAVIVNNSKTIIPDNLTELLKMEAHILIGKKSLISKSNWRQLLSIKGAVWRLILVITSWSLMFTCYYGTLLNIRSFGRQYLYVNTAIAGLSELIGGFVGFAILMLTKQKWAWVGALTGFTGILNCTIWLLPTHVDGSHMLLDLMTISMLNKIGISASLCVLTTCTAELFPLPHKKRVVYASTVCARTVFMTAPLIGFMAIYGDGVSLSFFGVLTAISGLFTIMLKPVKISKENKSAVWTVKIESNELTKL